MKIEIIDIDYKIDNLIIKRRVNPFIKLMEDYKRIDKAVQNGQPLSSLKDIKFLRPL